MIPINIQYITDDRGNRTNVILEIDEFNRLIESLSVLEAWRGVVTPKPVVSRPRVIHQPTSDAGMSWYTLAQFKLECPRVRVKIIKYRFLDEEIFVSSWAHLLQSVTETLWSLQSDNFDVAAQVNCIRTELRDTRNPVKIGNSKYYLEKHGDMNTLSGYVIDLLRAFTFDPSDLSVCIQFRNY